VSRLQQLDAYLTGELPDADTDAFEEAMFDAPDDPDLAFLDRVSRHGARLAQHGTFDMGVTRAQVDLLIDAGHKVQVIDAGPPGATGAWTMDADSQLIVTKLQLGRSDLERVDVEIELLDYNVTKTIKDVLVDRTEGVIYGLCERPLAQMAFGAGRTIARVRRCEGARDVVAEWYLSSVAAP
jgi:hypothetical protein